MPSPTSSNWTQETHRLGEITTPRYRPAVIPTGTRNSSTATNTSSTTNSAISIVSRPRAYRVSHMSRMAASPDVYEHYARRHQVTEWENISEPHPPSVPLRRVRLRNTDCNVSEPESDVPLSDVDSAYSEDSIIELEIPEPDETMLQTPYSLSADMADWAEHGSLPEFGSADWATVRSFGGVAVGHAAQDNNLVPLLRVARRRPHLFGIPAMPNNVVDRERVMARMAEQSTALEAENAIMAERSAELQREMAGLRAEQRRRQRRSEETAAEYEIITAMGRQLSASVAARRQNRQNGQN